MKPRVKKIEKHLILFPTQKLIILISGDENKNTSFSFNYEKNWERKLKFLKRKNNHTIEIIVSSKICKCKNEFYIPKDQKFVSDSFDETVNLVNQIMSGS